MHSSLFSPKPAEANKDDLLIVAANVERYLEESHLAKEWSESFDPAIFAHVHAQETYEIAQLLAEVGIVIASVAMLVRRRAPWLISVALGAVSIGFVVTTYISTGAAVHAAEGKIAETFKVYRDARNKNKTTGQEEKMIASIRNWANNLPAVQEPTHH